MSCEACKSKKTTLAAVPFAVHESAMARMERNAKRMWITIILLILFLVVSNCAWLYHESSFEHVSTTIEAEQDGSGNNVVGGGDANYGSESKDNN